MQPSNRMMLTKIDYKLGKDANANILHHSEQLHIHQEKLSQSSNPTRFYHAFEETFLFVLAGSLFLKSHQDDMVLKAHQGTLLPRDSIAIATLLEPNVELCLIQFIKAPHLPKDTYFKKLSSGTVEAQLGRHGMTIWPLWQGKNGTVAIHLYPSGYRDEIYYHRHTQQFLLPLTGSLMSSSNKQAFTPMPETGLFFEKRTPKAVNNNGQEGVSALCISTPFSEKGRVMVLTSQPPY